MGRKNKIEPYRVATTQSLGTSFQTIPTTVGQVDIIKYTVETSGVTDNTGSFFIQIRDVLQNTDPALPTATPWTNLSLSSTPVLNNSDTNFSIFVTQFVASQSRLAFVAAGTVPNGTCIVTVSASSTGG